MPKRPKINNGLNLYNRLLRELSQINRKLPEEKKLSLKERRRLLSSKIFPKYKSVPAYKFRITQVRKYMKNLVRRHPKKPTCDVNTLPEDLYAGIDYWRINDFLETKLPGCTWVKLSAGDFGETSIFNTREYDYHSIGVSDITNRINEYVRALPVKIRKKANYIHYTGVPRIRPKKPNISENYYLDLVLVVDNEEVKDIVPDQLPEKEKRKKKKLKKNVARELQQRQKKINVEKSRVKPIRKAIYKESSDFKIFSKKKFISDREKRSYAKKAFEQLKIMLDKNLKKKALTQKRYDEFIKEIKKTFHQK